MEGIVNETLDESRSTLCCGWGGLSGQKDHALAKLQSVQRLALTTQPISNRNKTKSKVIAWLFLALNSSDRSVRITDHIYICYDSENMQELNKARKWSSHTRNMHERAKTSSEVHV